MPKTKEEINEHRRQYYLKNKEKHQEYYLKNRETILQSQRQYRLNNKDKRKEYNKTEARTKSRRIRTWKKYGILCFDWDLLHELFIKTTHCEYCNCELYGVGNNKKCMDHDHDITDRFNVRGVLCQICNVRDVLS